MSCALGAKLLNFLGGLMILLPALHASWYGIKAERSRPKAKHEGGMRQIGQALSRHYEEIIGRLRPAHFVWMIVGGIVITAGFGLDVWCELP